MHTIRILFFIFLTYYINISKAETCNIETLNIRNFVQDIFEQNSKFAADYTEIASDNPDPTPKATILMCSDAKMNSNFFNNIDNNDLFIVRNVGNHISTSLSSVKYGILKLKTPILLIIGHSGCTATSANFHGSTKTSVNIKKEIDESKPYNTTHLNEKIIDNINYQVKDALIIFKNLIKDEQLTVIGALYDFKNDFKHGNSKLILVNINGETNTKKIENMKIIKDAKAITINEKK